MIRTSQLKLRDPSFDSRQFHFHRMTLSKLFTHRQCTCLYYKAVKFGTG